MDVTSVGTGPVGPGCCGFEISLGCPGMQWMWVGWGESLCGERAGQGYPFTWEPHLRCAPWQTGHHHGPAS